MQSQSDLLEDRGKRLECIKRRRKKGMRYDCWGRRAKQNPPLSIIYYNCTLTAPSPVRRSPHRLECAFAGPPRERAAAFARRARCCLCTTPISSYWLSGSWWKKQDPRKKGGWQHELRLTAQSWRGRGAQKLTELFLSIGLIVNLRSLKAMLRISNQGKPTLGFILKAVNENKLIKSVNIANKKNSPSSHMTSQPLPTRLKRKPIQREETLWLP